MIGLVGSAVRLLSRPDVERLLDLDALIDRLAAAFRRLSEGGASVPGRTAALAPGGLLGVMPAHLWHAGLGVKLVSVFPDNHARGLPSHQAVIVLFDEETGSPRAIMDGTAITAIRTGAASALSARLLAREDARTLAILGAGVQGEAHLHAMRRVRDLGDVRVASRSHEHALRFAAANAGVRAAPSFEAAVAGADIVCCCTDAAAPILQRGWLAAGAHVTSVGAARDGPELGPDVVLAGLLAVESRAASFLPSPAGCHELQGLQAGAAVEIGELVAGTRPGRRDQAQVTVYKSMGHAVEDLVAARIVLERAVAEGAGTPFEL